MTNEIPTNPFNWIELDRDSFLSWFVITTVAELKYDSDTYQEIDKATDHLKNTNLTMQINGIEIDALVFIHRLYNQFEEQVENAAKELLLDARLKMQAKLDPLLDVIMDTARKDLATLGIKITEDDGFGY